MFNNPYYNNPMPYNPMAPMQQRLQQYEQQNYSEPVAKNLVKCCAVTSIDEAKAAMIDLDGSMTIFTDLGHNKIYTKQINLDGTATLNSYALEKPVSQAQNTEVIEDRLKKLETSILVLKGEIENVKSNANVSNDKSNKNKSKSNANDAANVR